METRAVSFAERANSMGSWPRRVVASAGEERVVVKGRGEGWCARRREWDWGVWVRRRARESWPKRMGVKEGRSRGVWRRRREVERDAIAQRLD